MTIEEKTFEEKIKEIAITGANALIDETERVYHNYPWLTTDQLADEMLDWKYSSDWLGDLVETIAKEIVRRNHD